jgi:hypothetical protein
MKYPFEQIEDRYKKIPAQLQSVLSSPTTLANLQKIAKEFKLQIDETEELIDETGLVILGLTKRKDFANNLQKRLTVSEEVSKNITQFVDKNIFTEVREVLKKEYDQKDLSVKENIAPLNTQNLSSIGKQPEIKRETPSKQEMIKKPLAETLTPENDDIKLDRDTILKEIEHPTETLISEIEIPTPVSTTIPEVKNIPAPDLEKKEIVHTEIPEVKPTVTPILEKEITPSLVPNIKSNLTEEKLNGIVKIPKEDIEINEEIKDGEKVYTTKNAPVSDPYREPLD